MTITNHTDIQLLDNFEENYIDLKANYFKYLSMMIIDIYYLSDYCKLDICDQKKLEDLAGSPIGYIKPQNPGDYVHIILDKEFCVELSFSDDEIAGSVAHELGHLIVIDGVNDVDTEIRADHVAAMMGLGKELKSALEKMNLSGRFDARHQNSFKIRSMLL